MLTSADHLPLGGTISHSGEGLLQAASGKLAVKLASAKASQGWDFDKFDNELDAKTGRWIPEPFMLSSYLSRLKWLIPNPTHSFTKPISPHSQDGFLSVVS